MIELISVAAATAVVLASRMRQALVAYVVLALTVAAAEAAAVPREAAYLVPLALSAVLKVVVAPLAMVRLARSSPAAEFLRPAVSVPVKLVIAIALYGLASASAAEPALAGLPHLTAAVFALLCGAAVMMTNRNLLSGIVGLLLLDAGAALSCSELGARLPGALDMSAAFDALLVTLIGVLLARSLAQHVATFDVRALRRLRG